MMLSDDDAGHAGHAADDGDDDDDDDDAGDDEGDEDAGDTDDDEDADDDDDDGGDDDDDDMVPLCLEYLNFQLATICNFNCFLRHLCQSCGNTKELEREIVLTKKYFKFSQNKNFKFSQNVCFSNQPLNIRNENSETNGFLNNNQKI